MSATGEPQVPLVDVDADTPPGVRVLRRASDKHPTWKHVAYGAAGMLVLLAGFALWNLSTSQAAGAPSLERARAAESKADAAESHVREVAADFRHEQSLMRAEVSEVHQEVHAISRALGVRVFDADGGR